MKWIGGIYIILTFSFIQSMESPKEILYFNTYIFLEIVLNFFFFTKNWYEIRVIIKMCLSSHQILLHICYKMITPAYCFDIYTCNKHIKINRARIPPSPNLILIILNQTLKISTIIKKIFLYHF